ncbi:MAG: hypothetical protein NMK33_02740 [Candidatus Cardinium sp.]|uniref:hypothetical protein n=1 Tax=Cardinium endosymbiont of Dermatophagoides farinae TaxID=2597823 RepID=UPI001184239C|nr:hypothetical protein [Cardinium endosymbiont of Dermatophagoides farinae]TSJ81390.1 hypothetical protein FPG78_05415 [Cardinium endosymbiont of Dermatophagoides farinae]UWW97455.1 MAG: hypothetical protein NMK33_02740 [Candidatus Cardinium sp.]
MLILHAFNASIAQGKIDAKKAEKKYKIACEAINNMYSLADIQACAKYCCTKIEKALCSPSKNSCSPLKSLKKAQQSILQPIKDRHTCFLNDLKQYILDPIESGYDTLIHIVNRIQYRDESHLKEKVTDSIAMFYNIACSFGIIDLAFNVRHLVLVYRPSVKKKEACLKKIGREESQLLMAKFYLARFIAGNLNLDLIKKKITELLIF